MSRSKTFGETSDLVEALIDSIVEAKLSPCLIHGGHFVLDNKGQQAADYLADNHSESVPAQQFSEFAKKTWRLAIELFRRLQSAGVDPKLMVLVNDWQFLGGQGASRREREKDIAKRRSDYYQSVAELPDFHHDLVRSAGIDTESIFKASAEQWLFSEANLRTSLARSIKDLFDRNLAEERGLTKSFTPSGEPIISVESELEGDFSLLYCGSANCSGEVVELLRIIHGAGFRSFVNLYPEPCLGPVTLGTELARPVYKTKGLEVLNVAVPFAGSGNRYLLDGISL